MRKGKLICTLGPASDHELVIEGLILAGMNVARFNFSHGTHDDHRRRFELVRKVSARMGAPVAILQDIQGPKIRLGKFEGGEARVTTGERVTITTRNVLGTSELIPTPVKSLPRDLSKGEAVLLDDGRVRLRVLSVKDTEVKCEVEVGGTLKDRKGLNLPGSPMSIGAITPKDVKDLAFGQELGVDYVALSFVRTAEDVARARKHVKLRGTPLIAKIEKPQALDNLEAIIRESDGIMVARGDLGVELPLSRVPLIQKELVRRTNHAGKLVIVATEMLESMIQNPRPTRAEVSDVANAIHDGADAVMLSAESASGKYPVLAAQMMAEIVTEAERDLPSEAILDHLAGRDDISTGVAAAAVAAADRLMVDTIVAYTESGNTARLISELRPRARILGLTPSEDTLRRMALYWGVEGRRVARVNSTDAMLKQVREQCSSDPTCRPGAPVVIVTGVPLNSPGRTNMLTIHRI
jgi:pyruvate kinase